MNGRRTILCLFLLTALVVIGYFPLLLKSGAAGGGAFAWREAERTHTAMRFALPSPMASSIEEYPAYSPLAGGFMAIQRAAWGDSATPYHLVGIGLHLLATLLLWRLLLSLGISPMPSLLAAGLFAIHPVQVEAVAWIAVQGQLLAAVLGLAAALLWARWAGRGGILHYLAAIMLAGAAMLSDPSALVLPVGFLIVGWAAGSKALRNAAGVLPVAAGAVAIGAIACQFQGLLAPLPDFPWPSAEQRLPLLLCASAFYLAKLLLPVHLSLLYPLWPLHTPTAATWLALVGLMAGSVLLFAARKRISAGPLAALVFFLGAVAAAVFLAQDLRMAPVADSAAYFPAIGLLAFVAAAASRLVRKIPSLALPATAIGALLVLALVPLTFLRSAIFAGPEALYRDTLHKNPDSPIAALKLADLLLARQGSKANDEAIALYQLALARAPTLARPPEALATLYIASGRTVEAQTMLQKKLLAHPNDPQANEMLADMAVQSVGAAAYPQVLVYYQRAFEAAPDRIELLRKLLNVELALNRFPEAQATLEKALQKQPKNGEFHLELAKVYALEQKYPQAHHEYDVASAFAPGNAELFCNWGLMLIDARQPRLAEQEFRQALQLDPKNAKYQLHLGRALRDQGRLSLAVGAFESASTLDPTMADAFIETGNTYLMIQKEREAEDNYRAAIHVNPNDSEGYIRLANLLLNSRDPARQGKATVFEGITLLQKAVDDSHGRDLNLLVAYARALARGEVYDRAIDTVDRALLFGNLSGEQREGLLQLRQSFELATSADMPTRQGDSRIDLAGTGLEVVDEPPPPPPPQPRVKDLLAYSMDLRKPLDPDMFGRKDAETEAASLGNGFSVQNSFLPAPTAPSLPGVPPHDAPLPIPHQPSTGHAP